MHLNFLPSSKVLLDSAFGRTLKKVRGKKQEKDFFKNEKSQEILKIEGIGNALCDRLDSVVKAAPQIDLLDSFNNELISATIDVNVFRKSLAKFHAISKIVKRMTKEHIRKIKAKKFREGERGIHKESSAFFGRIFSLFKDFDKFAEDYNDCAKKLSHLPVIDSTLPTVVLAGYPNVGKSTLIGRLTDSQPKVAPYPFTTQGLMIGYFEHRYRKIQVIDTPGLLDRPFEKRNAIEKKAISALKHLAKILVFLIDPTKTSGYSLQEQKNLFDELKKFNIPTIIVINKTDICSTEEVQNAIDFFEKTETIVFEGEKIDSLLKQKIVEFLGIPK